MITLPPNDSDYFNEKDSPKVELLKPEYLDNAFDSTNAAFENDPMTKYINADEEKRSPARLALTKRLWKIISSRSIKHKLTYTVNAGDAVIFATPAESDVAKSPTDRAIDFLLDAVVKAVGFLNGSEQMKRTKVLETKAKRLREEKLGDSVKEMIQIELLATKPESQGRGYGSALLGTIIFMADIRGRSIYLFSSNVANVSYYESFGFATIAQTVLGDDNPNWHNPPVVIPMMVRKPRIVDIPMESS